jgi:type II secretory pathway component PulL
MKTGLIDLMDNELILYIVEKDGSGYRIIDTTSVPLDGKPIEHALSDLSGIYLDHVYLSIPLSMLSLRELEFPFSDRKKIAEIIKFEIDGLLFGNANDYIIEHLITHLSEDRCKVLAVCIEKKRLEEIIKTFSSAGLEPRTITSLDVCLLNVNEYGKASLSINEIPGPGDEKRTEMALNELKKTTINLRQGEFRYRGDIENIGKKFRLVIIFCTVLLLTFATGNLINLERIKNENETLSKMMYEIYHDAFPDDKKIIDPLRQFRGRVNQIMKKRKVFGGTSPIDILRNIADISDLSDHRSEKKGSIKLNEFKSENDSILIKGVADTFEGVEILRNKLVSYYDEVKVLDSELSHNKKVDFTIMMKVREI